MSQAEIMRVMRKEDLVRSGLGKPATARKLQYGEMLSKTQTYSETGVEDAVSYVIPYFAPDRRPLNYVRWKLFALSQVEQPKYIQEEKTIPRLYLPPLVDWTKICEDPSIRIVITEGEKKAACATNLGMPCIALGGVWSFTAKKWHLKAIPDWDWFKLKDREVEVCYDGDMYTNDNVAKALDALTAMLTKRGARVFIRYLPQTEGLSKLDDYLVAKGLKAYGRLECPEADNSVQMNNLNDDLVYVKNVKSWFSTYERIMYGHAEQLRRRYGDITIQSDTGRPIAAIDEWTRWPHRRMADRITYEPGEPQFINGAINDWRGYGVEPRRGNCKEFLEVIREVENHEWLLQWLAYPLQHQGAKLFTAALLWSVEQGTGKTFIGDVMRDIYGENANVITSVDLHDDSFVWARNKQFILGEEVVQTRSRADAGIMKFLITGSDIPVNEKYVPHYTVPNRCNFMLTSNQPDAIFMDRGDRRFFVGKLDKERPIAFWNALDKWRRNDGGPAAFMYYLMNSVDTKSFNPNAPAPVTAEKKQMQFMGLTSLEQWTLELMEDPAGVLETRADGVGKLHRNRDVFSVDQLIDFLPKNLERETNNVKLGKALTKMGAIRSSGPVRLTNRKQIRLYAIRNTEEWRSKLSDKRVWAANYEGKAAILKTGRKRK